MELIKLKILKYLLRWYHERYFVREKSNVNDNHERWTAVDTVRGYVYKHVRDFNKK
jgi:hypothetical protein